MKRESAKRIKNLICCCLAIITVGLMMAAMVLGTPIVRYKCTNENETELVADKVTGAGEQKQEYEYDVADISRTNQSLIFFTNHQIIHVYADGTEVYAVEKQEGMFAGTTGARWNYVEILPDTAVITICLEAVYAEYPMKGFEVTVGNARQDIQDKIRTSFPTALVDSFIVFIGIALVIYWLYERINIIGEKISLYFGLFTVLIGCWCFNETEFASLLLENRCGASFVAFVLLMLIPIPYVKYIEAFLNNGRKLFTTIYITACVLNLCICIPLHLMGIVSLKQTALISHLLLGIGALYQLWTLIVRCIKSGMDAKVKNTLIGVVGIVLAALVDMGYYYTSMQKNPVFSHMGILLTVCILGWGAFREARKNVEELKSIQIYKEMAIKDLQTGLYNRNAYDKWIQTEHDFCNVAIVVCDINDLKKCNDTFGHDVGDVLIQQTAALIKEVFGNKGILYRIGGDEFCIVLRNVAEDYVCRYIEKFKKMQKLKHDRRLPVNLSIACGYACYDGKLDTEIEDTRKRADTHLYEDKKRMKGIK